MLVTGNVVPSSPTHVILTMEALRSSETSVLTSATHTESYLDSLDNPRHMTTAI
jgi:hypothetical protein